MIGTLGSSKLPLGIVGGDSFDDSAVDVPDPGVAAILMYSDGIDEARNLNGEMFSSDGVRSLIDKCSAGDLIASVREGWRRFCEGRAPDDDATLVAISLIENGKGA